MRPDQHTRRKHPPRHGTTSCANGAQSMRDAQPSGNRQRYGCSRRNQPVTFPRIAQLKDTAVWHDLDRTAYGVQEHAAWSGWTRRTSGISAIWSVRIREKQCLQVQITHLTEIIGFGGEKDKSVPRRKSALDSVVARCPSGAGATTGCRPQPCARPRPASRVGLTGSAYVKQRTPVKIPVVRNGDCLLADLEIQFSYVQKAY